MSEEDAIGIQREIVAREKAKEMVKAQRLKRDVRSQMSRSGWYNPEGDGLPEGWKPQLYPTWVHIKENDGSTRSVIANNKQEHDALLGKKTEPAKIATVDISQLVTQQPEAPKRGRPPKAKAVSLPQNLD